MHSAKPCAATNKFHPLRCSHDKIEYNTDMATRTTTVNHSDLPCTCTSMDQYVDGLCPGCTEAADRDADLKEHLDAQADRESCEGACDAGPACHDEDEPREGDDDRYYSGTGERMDDESYERYLNRG